MSIRDPLLLTILLILSHCPLSRHGARSRDLSFHVGWPRVHHCPKIGRVGQRQGNGVWPVGVRAWRREGRTYWAKGRGYRARGPADGAQTRGGARDVSEAVTLVHHSTLTPLNLSTFLTVDHHFILTGHRPDLQCNGKL